jgi:hypothetical protein
MNIELALVCMTAIICATVVIVSLINKDKPVDIACKKYCDKPSARLPIGRLCEPDE